MESVYIEASFVRLPLHNVKPGENILRIEGKKVRETPFFTLDMINDAKITRVYDPRLSVVENELLICFAVDTRHGIRGGIGRVK